eukprot:4435241-Alexandrium_andersonii.AAC.1
MPEARVLRGPSRAGAVPAARGRGGPVGTRRSSMPSGRATLTSSSSTASSLPRASRSRSGALPRFENRSPLRSARSSPFVVYGIRDNSGSILPASPTPVSYTHLTLPTICSV